MASRHEANLLELERRFNAGDKNALADAVLLVVFNKLEPPPWVRISFLDAHARVAQGLAKSWDDVLGKRHKGRHLAHVRRRVKLWFPVWQSGRTFRRNGVSVGPALWSRLAAEFHIGERQAREFYYRGERNHKR